MKLFHLCHKKRKKENLASARSAGPHRAVVLTWHNDSTWFSLCSICVTARLPGFTGGERFEAFFLALHRVHPHIPWRGNCSAAIVQTQIVHRRSLSLRPTVKVSLTTHNSHRKLKLRCTCPSTMSTHSIIKLCVYAYVAFTQYQA